MRVNDLRKIDGAPARGQLLAYLRTEVLFQPYDSVQEVKKILGECEILELHMFDEDKEYRCLVSESVRFEGNCIEYISEFEDAENSDEVYKENCLLESGGKMTVLSHMGFDKENGMAIMDDYRLRMGGQQNG